MPLSAERQAIAQVPLVSDNETLIADKTSGEGPTEGGAASGSTVRR
jgi:hypothetical protein